MQKILTYIKNHYIFLILFIILASVRVWYVIQPGPIWWDSSIYVGIGKYIFSGGELGLWETFRPLALPILQGLSWKIGLDPIVFGKMFVLVLSLGSLVLAYLLGKKIEGEKTGLLAMALLGTMPVYFYFTNLPITDVLSVAICLFSIYLYSRDKYVASGLVAGLAFAFRFPQGLLIVALGLAIIFGTIHFRDLKTTLKQVFSKLLFLGLGFSFILVPYLIFNYIQYKDLLLPFREGTAILIGPSFYLYDKGPFFYFVETFKQNPLLYFALPSLLVGLLKWKTLRKNKAYLATASALIIFGAYFTYQPHKELRYAIAFLPYVSILASFAIIFGLTKLPKKIRYALVAGIVLFLAYFVYIHRGEIVRPIYSTETLIFENYFKDKPNVTVVTTSPFHVVEGDITIYELYETYETGTDALVRRKATLDYITLDTSQIFCQEAKEICDSKKNAFIKKLDESGIVVYKKILPEERELYIYQIVDKS